MFNLIKLEIKKFKLQGYIKIALIVHFVIIAIFLLVQGEQSPLADMVMMNTRVIELLGRITFIVFAGVILGKLVIDEYNNKTINLMFMYPISRKKIILAKLIIVVVFIFINMLISNMLMILALAIANSIFSVLAWELTIESAMSKIPNMIINAAVASVTALIPLYFGMKKKSISATIIAAVIGVSIMYSGSDDMLTISSILPIAITVSVIGVLVGIGVLNKLDTEDVV